MTQLNAYSKAQRAIADLKSSVLEVMLNATDDGLTNAEIGRCLGIYHGHIKHEGHIPRTMLALMEDEGVVEQDAQTKKWRIRSRLEVGTSATFE